MSSSLVRSFAVAPLFVLSLVGCGFDEPALTAGTDSLPDLLPGSMPDQQSKVDPECPSDLVCEDIPAAYKVRDAATGSYGNYDVANRPMDGQAIRYIVIHTTEGRWDGVVSHFQDPSASASAHYLVGSQTGRIAKFVSPKHVAWHAGNWYFNMHSIGIEHEAVAIEGKMWFTDAMYEASAKLVRHLAQSYGVPLDREHIIGHDEIPGVTAAKQSSMHWDPGPYFDWDRYMQLLRAPLPSDADPGQSGTPIVLRPGYATNLQKGSYCFGTSGMDCRDVADAPANFVYLRTAADPMAPLVENQYLKGWPGDRMNNWGTKLGTGPIYVLAEQKGDWSAIYFGGQKAWFQNPGRSLTRKASAMVITPRSGLTTAPLYGVAYPQDTAFMPPTKPVTMEKIYDVPAGQRYALAARATGDYYWAKEWVASYDPSKQIVVKDGTEYYQVHFNHRVAWARAADFELISTP
jgi:hypothetical protein